VPWKIWLRT